MAKLIYMAIASLDGYVADEDGNFEWAKPDEEVHAFVNDLERPIGTHLYGRRLYEVMIGWETMHTLPDQTPQTLDFAAIWQAAEKVVYSRTLETVSSARTRIERDFAPDAVRRMKAAAERDISIGGADARGRGDQGRPGRRAPPDRQPDRRGRRHALAARRRARGSSTCSTSAASPTAWSTCATARATSGRPRPRRARSTRR